MRFINLTPHKINVFNGRKQVLALQPCDKPARVYTTKEGQEIVGGVPIYTRQKRIVKNLPEPFDNTLYVVSGFVLNFCSERSDLVAPDTSNESLMKDSKGKIIGVKSLVMVG